MQIVGFPMGRLIYKMLFVCIAREHPYCFTFRCFGHFRYQILVYAIKQEKTVFISNVYVAAPACFSLRHLSLGLQLSRRSIVAYTVSWSTFEIPYLWYVPVWSMCPIMLCIYVSFVMTDLLFV